MKVVVNTVTGDTIEVDVESKTVSVMEVLEAAGLSASNMKITIDGQRVYETDRLSEGQTLTLSEKPSGS